MFWFEQFRSIVLLPNFSYLAPLLIIGCFLISFRYWLDGKWYVAAAIYGLSIFTAAVVQTVSHSAELAAVVGGVLAPTLYSLIFLCLGIIRVLHSPYGKWFSSLNRSRPANPGIRLLQGAIGGLIGGMTGSTMGGLLSVLLLLLFPLASPGFSFDWHRISNFHTFINHIILFCGGAGISLGIMTGYGLINQKQVGDRLLIGLAIHLYVLISLLKQMLRSKKFWLKK